MLILNIVTKFGSDILGSAGLQVYPEENNQEDTLSV
jgi:hypothetical protein